MSTLDHVGRALRRRCGEPSNPAHGQGPLEGPCRPRGLCHSGALVRRRRRVSGRPRAGRAWLFTLLLASGCIPLFQKVTVQGVDPAGGEVGYFQTPIRAFLLDGSVAFLPTGGSVTPDSLQGLGTRFDITLENPRPFGGIPTDSVVGIEVYDDASVDLPLTVLAAAASTAATIALGIVASVAIFGSCPTVYADVGGEPAVQMEAFSYSIVPLFESRDVAALRLDADATSGETLTLELRNEALETHFVNHLSLLVVDHSPDLRAVPDPTGRPLLVGGGAPPLAARDRAGRDVGFLLAARDESAFRTARSRLGSVTEEDLTDHVDLIFPRPAGGAGDATLVLDLKNTLFNSLLFYDVMLADAGSAAIDWLGSDLDRIGPALELGRWYQDRMGLRVLVDEGGEWIEADHVGDVGPIAWKELAVPIRLPAGNQDVKVRLEFVADSWFIDRAGLAGFPVRPEVVSVAPSEILGPDGAVDEQAWSRSLHADEMYLATYPGQSYQVSFRLPGEPDESRTLLLAAQGYYREWIRGPWLDRTSRARGPFEPSDDALVDALGRWDQVMEAFESDFHGTRIPVR